MIFQNPVNLLGHIVHWKIAVDRDQPARLLVVIRHRPSLLLKRRESWLNDFQPVIIAGYQLGPVRFVANFIQSGRLEMDVINPSTGGTRTSSSNPEQ